MAYVHRIGTATLAIAAALAAPAYAQDGNEDSSVTEVSSSESQPSPSKGPTPFYGRIDPFYGRIDPFYGRIDPFYGRIDPFYGRIDPFYGRIDPFWDDISPFYGDISAFWGDIGAFWGDISPFESGNLASIGNFWNDTAGLFTETDATWDAYATSSDPIAAAALEAQLVGQLNTLIATSKSQWAGAVTDKTGLAFDAAFVAPILARHGIDLNNPASLASLTASQRAAFFFDWHDTLMGYSGIDAVDHWMGAINWTPAITQIQGSKGVSVIGILDSSLTGSDDLADNLVNLTGKDGFVSGHGAGVASLMIAAHDGEGVMGIAPNAKVVAHNPFDANGDASWADVEYGISMLNQGEVSIVNLSLGEAGTVLSQEWQNVLTSESVLSRADKTVYVLAAGNDGIAQTADIEWSGAFETAFILVGSVSPDGTVSEFSNTPGSACLLDGGVCWGSSDLGQSGNLMNRFIVAPGELLLVDDGFGGVTRQSGTSLSAPLVSGAIALLHDRWPWLANHSDATVEIILGSARDLGAPGVDPVYGVGMLDVVASQSPLNFNAMTFTMYQRKGHSFKSSTQSASRILDWGVPSWWETDDVFFAMYENVGGTYRDFAVPMSSYTTGKRTNVLGGGYQRLQDFISDRFARWIHSRGQDKDGDGVSGFNQLHTGAVRQAGDWRLQYTSAMPRYTENGALDPVHAAAELTDPTGQFSFTMGYGSGAMALSGNRFGVVSDFDREVGGANPVLGFASGEFFTGASMLVSPQTKLSFGYSQNRFDWEDVSETEPLARFFQAEIGAHEAHAFTANLEQGLTKDLSLNLQYTNMIEDNALLGAQAGSDLLLGEGAATEAVTFSGTLQLGNRTRLDVAATASESELAEGQFLSSEDAVFGTAAQISLTRNAILSEQDSLRVTVGQPLNIERGELQFYSLQVIDRATGERGMVAQNIGIATKRRMMGELVYAAPVLDTGEIGLFGRFVSEGITTEGDGVMIGANFGLRF